MLTDIRNICGGIAGAVLCTISSRLLESNPCLAAFAGFVTGFALTMIFIPSYPSKIDENIRVTKRKWTITLIQHGGPGDQHVQLAIEGVGSNGYFLQLSELTGTCYVCLGSAIVETTPLDKVSPQYSRRSEVWSLPYDKVKKMIDAIKQEEGKEKSLNLLGRYSWLSLSGQDSCITWAIEKLKIAGINLSLESLSRLVTISSDFTYPKQHFTTTGSS